MNNEEIQKNRLWNFRQIIRSVDGTNEAARIMGKKNSYITQIAGPNPQRNIGNRMATMIETAFGLNPGSLDTPPPKQLGNEDPYLSQLCAVLANAPDTDKELVLAIAEWLAGRSMKLPAQKTGIGIVIDPKDISS
jgi:hypothetical protein